LGILQDESNVSLTAFLGKTCAPCGETPKARVTGNRGGVAGMTDQQAILMYHRLTGISCGSVLDAIIV